MNNVVKSGFFRKIFGNSLIQLLIAIFLCSNFYSHMSIDTIKFFLTISSCLKELLVCVLPFLLFSFVAVALSAIPKNSMAFVFTLMVVVFISNFINVLVSGTVGFFILSGATAKKVADSADSLQPFFSLGLPEIISTVHALAIGVVIGFINSLYPNKYVDLAIKLIRDYVMKFMKGFFVPLFPVFISGFLLKLFAEGRITSFVSDNYRIFITMCGFLVCYLTLWLMMAAAFHRNRMLEILKNTFPAIVTAFSTMSSAAALPLSLVAAEKNTKDKVLADAVMPLTLNFHMVGDTIIIPILAMTVMIAFNHPLPSVNNFIMFGLFFILNKFAGGGVPSGTIMVTLPVLKEYLNFDDAMLAFAMAFYGIIDPIATAGNVTANNFFVVIFQKFINFTKKAHIRKRPSSVI